MGWSALETRLAGLMARLSKDRQCLARASRDLRRGPPKGWRLPQARFARWLGVPRSAVRRSLGPGPVQLTPAGLIRLAGYYACQALARAERTLAEADAAHTMTSSALAKPSVLACDTYRGHPLARPPLTPQRRRHLEALIAGVLWQEGQTYENIAAALRVSRRTAVARNEFRRRWRRAKAGEVTQRASRRLARKDAATRGDMDQCPDAYRYRAQQADPDAPQDALFERLDAEAADRQALEAWEAWRSAQTCKQ